MSLLFTLIRGSRWTFALALIASVISGFANATLVALINRALHLNTDELAKLGWPFLGLVVLVLVMRTLGQTCFVRLGQQAKATLRMQTIRNIAAAPFQAIEQYGAARALNILTQDLDSIVVFFVSLPNLVMYGAVIAGCLVYLGSLSWPVLLVALVAVLTGAIGYVLVNRQALVHLRGSRQREDQLVRHFRALFDGAKELKLHQPRNEMFVERSLAPEVEAVRAQRSRGYVLYAAAASWGSLIFFSFIGCVLFVLTRYYAIPSQVLSGYAVVFLYMIMPIEGLLSALPSVGNARVAFERIRKANHDLPSELTTTSPVTPKLQTLQLAGITHRYFREQENSVLTRSLFAVLKRMNTLMACAFRRLPTGHGPRGIRICWNG
ncbi:ABC-type siderophore export system fused ATPase/permease subunit [Silvimonas terrae]|uniref:ABC-type siderophore export system fused ATPase/permease subunit n=1 Tax=Silvimonas terrae TaxID=300266 RepID=A0A840RF96_9NEIS|nr:ABC transporter transmembrane domain-containing protein [Silvimonas terrae]MBB5191244.1 ABC-type siderophore export system fused ATPase/permease subunit [Silvimonas terrae]